MNNVAHMPCADTIPEGICLKRWKWATMYEYSIAKAQGGGLRQ
jgi:hypothetical protein